MRLGYELRNRRVDKRDSDESPGEMKAIVRICDSFIRM